MSELMTISYKTAEKEGLVGRAYSAWIKRVPHLDPMTRGEISLEWKANNVELVISKEDLNSGD